MNACDWGQCPREPAAGAFCWFHADEYERVRAEQDREWWSCMSAPYFGGAA